MPAESLPIPLISIVVPVYNVAKFLPAMLDSILAQTETRWECVLVDDGSKDESYTLAQSYVERHPRLQLYQQENAGPSVARNLGYRFIHPQSRYVTFMDSDDIWTETALADLLSVLERTPEAIAVSGLAEFIDEHGNIFDPGVRAAVMRNRRTVTASGIRLLEVDEPTGFASFCMGSDQFPPGVILGRRAVYDKVGGFDVTIRGCEDWDFLVRASRHGLVAFLNKIVLFYRRHGHNLGASAFVPQETWRLKCIIYHSPENSPEQKQIVRLAWRLGQRALAREQCRLAWSQFKTGRFGESGVKFAKAVRNGLRSFVQAPQPAARPVSRGSVASFR